MRNHIIKALLKSTYQTPESIRNRINARVSKYYYVDTISRELRKMRQKDLVESKAYPNKTGRGTHLRWVLKGDK